MPRKTPAQEGSWIFEGDTSGADTEGSPPPPSPPSRTVRKSRESEFIMPSMADSGGSSQPRKRRKLASPVQPARQPTKSNTESNLVASYIRTLMIETVVFCSSVLAMLWTITKPLMIIAVTIGIMFLVVSSASKYLVGKALGPLCAIPGLASYLDLPFCSTAQPAQNVQFDGLMTVQSAFEDVLQTSSSEVNLPWDMKRGEASMRDLKHVIEYSALPSRQELVFELKGFIDCASQAAADLIRFNTRIGRSVDQVININRWTLKVIDSVAEKDRNKGVVSRFMENATPFGHGQVTEQALFDQFIRHTSAIEDQIVSLIEEAQALLGILQNLDDRLEVIHGLAARDGFLVGVSRDELFAQLWTKLGGNRKSKKKVDAQLALLNHVGSYRRAAFERISHTILTLSAIHNGLEDLREQVAAPEVLANSGTNLDLHIQQIQSAVERLDERRRTSRRLEADEQRRTLDKPEQLALPA